MTTQSARDRSDKARRLERLCRDQGIPLTHQRRVVLAAIENRKDHPTADQVYEAVRPQIPSISRMTVYRVLELLVRLGVITKVGHPGAVVRFEPSTIRHHHLVCLRCNKLIDWEDPALDGLDLPDAGRLGFQVTDYSVQIQGVCEECRLGEAGSRASRTGKAERRPPRHRS